MPARPRPKADAKAPWDLSFIRLAFIREDPTTGIAQLDAEILQRTFEYHRGRILWTYCAHRTIAALRRTKYRMGGFAQPVSSPINPRATNSKNHKDQDDSCTSSSESETDVIFSDVDSSPAVSGGRPHRSSAKARVYISVEPAPPATAAESQIERGILGQEENSEHIDLLDFGGYRYQDKYDQMARPSLNEQYYIRFKSQYRPFKGLPPSESRRQLVERIQELKLWIAERSSAAKYDQICAGLKLDFFKDPNRLKTLKLCPKGNTGKGVKRHKYDAQMRCSNCCKQLCKDCDNSLFGLESWSRYYCQYIPTIDQDPENLDHSIQNSIEVRRLRLRCKYHPVVGENTATLHKCECLSKLLSANGTKHDCHENSGHHFCEDCHTRIMRELNLKVKTRPQHFEGDPIGTERLMYVCSFDGCKKDANIMNLGTCKICSGWTKPFLLNSSRDGKKLPLWFAENGVCESFLMLKGHPLIVTHKKSKKGQRKWGKFGVAGGYGWIGGE